MERWEINGDILEFDEETHTYWVNGEKRPSVTQVIKFKFPNKYGGVDEAVLKRAAEKGTELHESIEIYETYGITSEELQEFRNYLFLKQQFKFDVVECEKPIILKYKDLVVCGRLDLVLKDNGKLCLGDIKRTSVLDKEYLAYQLNLYRLAYQQCYGELIEGLRGIHLRKEKRKYLELPINEEITYQLLEEYIGGMNGIR